MNQPGFTRALSLATALGATGCAGVVHTRSEVVVARPRDEVFAYLADFEHMPRWNYYVTNVARTTPGPTRLGTRFHQTRRDDAQDYLVTELAPGQRLAVATLPPARALTLRFALDDVPGGTRVVETWALDAGAASVLAPLVAWRIASAVTTNLRVLRGLLEDGRAVLPDGRTTTP